MNLTSAQRLRLIGNLIELEENCAENDIVVVELLQNQKYCRRKKRRHWVRSWLLRRPILGQYERLMRELSDEDVPAFKNFVRVEPAMFQEILARVGPRITKEDTWYR